jgi:hypothetical protein
MRSVESQTVERGKRIEQRTAQSKTQGTKTTQHLKSHQQCVLTQRTQFYSRQLRREFIDQIYHIVNIRLESSLMEGVSEPERVIHRKS